MNETLHMTEVAWSRALHQDMKERDDQTEGMPHPRLLPLGTVGTKYDHARRPTTTYHLDSPEIAMGDRHVLLRRVARWAQLRTWIEAALATAREEFQKSQTGTREEAFHEGRVSAYGAALEQLDLLDR